MLSAYSTLTSSRFENKVSPEPATCALIVAQPSVTLTVKLLPKFQELMQFQSVADTKDNK